MRLIHINLGQRLLRSLPLHHHDHPVIICYTRGRGRIRFADRTFEFRRDTVACVPGKLAYAEDSIDGFKSLYVLIEGLMLPEPQAFTVGEDRRVLQAAELLLEESRHSDPRHPGTLEQSLAVLVHHLRRHLAPPAHSPLVTQALDLIRMHAMDAAFTIPALARRISVTMRTLRSRFATEVGSSPRQYLLQRRIEEAKRMLIDGGFLMQDIAAQVGFSDPYYFSRSFRQQVGMSPQQFRAQLSGDRRASP